MFFEDKTSFNQHKDHDITKMFLQYMYLACETSLEYASYSRGKMQNHIQGESRLGVAWVKVGRKRDSSFLFE